MRVLVTGCAGFIGMYCADRLLARGDEVIGVDNLSPYYAVALKRARLARLETRRGFRFHEIDISEAADLEAVFAHARPDRVLHLAAQAGVRYSLVNPQSYVQANLVGFANVLECCRRHRSTHLVYASSSSVYGNNPKQPWSEADNVDHPISFYAATKKSNELMAHSYSHLFGLATTGLRYFTVYGPWGRPDMSPMLFAEAILAGRPIQVFNQGDMQRDFTYVEDIAEGTLRVLDRQPGGTPPCEIFNIGNHQPVALLEYIGMLEQALGARAKLDLQPMQPGDVRSTYADTERLRTATGFAPSTPLADGLQRFADWFRAYRAGRSGVDADPS